MVAFIVSLIVGIPFAICISAAIIIKLCIDFFDEDDDLEIQQNID